jgi:ABC-2 type transport system permease protein
MRAVYRKEMRSYFYTPTGWLFIAVFLSLAGLLFYLNNILPRSSDYSVFLSMMSYVWMLLTPILVMRLMAGERRGMTDKLMQSSPLSITSLVIGKYFAACTVMLIAVSLSLTYPLLMSAYARVYPLEVLSGTLGFLLQGCAFIALDLMVTSMIRNTFSAAALAFGINLFVWLMSLMTSSATLPAALARCIAFVSLYERFIPFLSAQLSPANILFYLMFCISMLTVSITMVKLERARER